MIPAVEKYLEHCLAGVLVGRTSVTTNKKRRETLYKLKKEFVFFAS